MPVSFSCSVQASHCSGLSCCRAWTQGTWASIAVAHWLSCPVACGILLDQGSNPCPLHWQAYSWPLDHQGSLLLVFIYLWYFLNFWASQGQLICLFSSGSTWIELGFQSIIPLQGVWELCLSTTDPAAYGMTAMLAFVVKKEAAMSFSSCTPSAPLQSVLKTYSVCIVTVGLV